MNKLLVVCGPTATGKTSLALKFAKLFDGELISADSRQVYKGMDIGTGKDRPRNALWHSRELPITNFQFPIGYWETKENVRIWGYDLVEPKEDFSVAEYVEVAKTVIRDIWEKGKLPILVGGTGFYIKGVVDGIGTIDVPRDEKLREGLEEKTVESLYEELEGLDREKALSMNESDKKNPARLVRAIEVANWKLEVGGEKLDKDMRNENSRNEDVSFHNPDSHFSHPISTLFVGLIAPRDLLNKRIEKRVEERIEKGVEEEIRTLLKNGVTWTDQSMKAMGYREWRDFFEKQETESRKLDEVIGKWKQDERKYAKRQMTWFKKDKRVEWFDITKKEYPENVVKRVEKWHTK